VKTSGVERVRVAQLEIVVLSLMLLGAACSGTNSSSTDLNRPTSSPQRYVSVVCTAVLNWKNSVEIEASSVVMQATSLKDATAYLKGILRVTDQMLGRVRAVGVPTAPDGPNLQGDVVHRLAAARAALLRVQAEVARLLAQSAIDLVKEVELPILSTVEAVKSELRNPSRIEMAQATVSDPDCNRLFQRKALIGISA
jgi:hypothetical protein